MAILNGIATKLKGSAGSLTFRNPRQGGTIVSEKVTEVKNTRTSAQQRNRLKWPNIIETYRGIMPLLIRAFENKAERVSDYNMFVKMNMQEQPVYLTKNEVTSGACVIAPYQLTQGSLPSIEVSGTGTNRVTNIYIGSLVIDANTTVAAFSNAVVNNNGPFNYGDKLAFYLGLQSVNATSGIPYASFSGSAVTLSKDDSSKLLDIVNALGFKNVDGYIGHNTNEGNSGLCWVHTRTNATTSKTLISSQQMIVSNSLLENYTSEEAFERAAATYGGVNEVFLAPGGNSSFTPTPTPPTPTTPVTITAKVATGQEAQGTVKAGSSAAGATSSVTVEKDTSVQVVATPASGYKFKQWNTGETTATLNLIANADTTVTATFEPDSPTGTVTVTLTSADASQGKVQINMGEVGATATATVQSGAATVIKAIPEAGYTFSKWSDGGLQFERTINPTQDVSLTATFEAE